MTTKMPVIHLHGGPIDGLRLAWNDLVPDKVQLFGEPTQSMPEYDYVYLPRLPITPAATIGVVLPPCAKKTSCWQRWGIAIRSWLLTPCSYPFDMQRYGTDSTRKQPAHE